LKFYCGECKKWFSVSDEDLIEACKNSLGMLCKDHNDPIWKNDFVEVIKN